MYVGPWGRVLKVGYRNELELLYCVDLHVYFLAVLKNIIVYSNIVFSLLDLFKKKMHDHDDYDENSFVCEALV